MGSFIRSMLIGVGFALAGSPAAFGAGNAAVYNEAARVLANAKITSYQHHTEIDEAKGLYRLDCSGFVGYALSRSAAPAWDSLRQAVKENHDPAPIRPLAMHFVWYFDQPASARKGWQRVRKIRNLHPGDVVAWLTPDDSSSDNTGHVVFVKEAPRPNPNHEGEWLLAVMDSTSSGHGSQDPRKKTGPNGLGTGPLSLVEGEDGSPTGYRWRGVESVRVYETEMRMARAR